MTVNTQWELEGKTAIVTGASRGIGRAVALRLAREGAWVLLNCASNTAKAEEVLKEIEGMKAEGIAPASAGGAVRAFSVANEALVNDAVQSVLADQGKVDILVNNAGITRDNLMLRHSAEDWDTVLETNLKGTFLMTKAVTKAMMKARAGSIVNMSSVVAQMGNSGQGSYCASKAGIIGFSKSAARELGSRGVRVNVIAPGFIETDMTNQLPEDARKAMADNIALRRFGSVEDIAEATLWLASLRSAYVTGQVIGINGGLYM